YFRFLRGMIGSVRDREEGRSARLCIFDLGLTDVQRKWLAAQGAELQIPKWPFRRSAPTVIAGLMARPPIPGYFPGAGVYVWIDADAWVQDWSAIRLYVASARASGFAVTAEMDRSYPMRQVWGFHSQMMTPFGKLMAEAVLDGKPINAGVFAGMS